MMPAITQAKAQAEEAAVEDEVRIIQLN